MDYQREQSRLLVKVVPFLDPFKCFAFHGGTVINLFSENSPKRYSIDLDAVFIPDKNIDLKSDIQIVNSIDKNLDLLKKDLLIHKNDLNIIDIRQPKNRSVLYIIAENPLDTNSVVNVKIEVNRTYTGLIGHPYKKRLALPYRLDFNTDCWINSVSDVQLYGSKIAAMFGRNEIKDSYDLYYFLSTNKDIAQYKEGIIYSILSNRKNVLKILNMNYNEIPKDFKRQMDTLGSYNYSLGKHLFTRKRVKEILFESLKAQDLYYILASDMGVLDKTDYAFKNMRGVILQNKENKEYRENHPRNYQKKAQSFIELPLLKKHQKTLKKQLKDLETKTFQKPMELGF